MSTSHLEAALDSFRSAAQADPRVVAAFVGGSLAVGSADQYSDLDLYVILADEHYDSFFAERVAFVRQLGQPVLLQDFNGFGFDMIVFMFENGVKGELGLARASRFLHIHGGPYRVLVDKAALLEGVTFPGERVPYEQQRSNLEQMLQAFWRDLDLATGALGRGHLLSAMAYLEELRRKLVRVCRIRLDFADGGDHPRPEALLTPSALEQLERTYPHLQRDEMLAALRACVQLFQQVARPMAAAHGIAYPTALEQVACSQFDTMAGTQ